jgi:hypothetical protein
MEPTLMCDGTKRRSEQGGAAARMCAQRRGFRFGTLFAGLGLLLGFSSSLRGQGAPIHSNTESAVLAADTAPELQSAPSTDAGSFAAKVKTRFQVARKGTILIVMPRSCKAGDTIEARIIVQRPPAGADGLLLTSSANEDGVTALLKVDDEMAVELSADGATPIQINSQDPHPQLPLHRILPGGHSEWTWNIKAVQPGEQHLTVTSDVVYRRNFLTYDPPIIRIPSFTHSLPLQVLP